MAEILLLNESEVTDNTIISGNVDKDKYMPSILQAQVKIIEPLLGSLLYDYILANKNTLTGLYLILFTEYIKPILKFSTVANYVTLAPYMVDNGGIHKFVPDGKELVSTSEKTEIIQFYNGLADMYIIRFEKWICKNPISEYKTYQEDGVNATKNIRTTIGWKI